MSTHSCETCCVNDAGIPAVPARPFCRPLAPPIPWAPNHQAPVAIQLAVFLFHAGHYGNATSLENVAQWTGFSMGLVVNFSNRLMVVILDEHDTFVNMPPHDSEDMERARTFTESCACPAWRNGVFATDGSSIPLFEKPHIFGETFYDRKCRYSLNCQVCTPTHVE